MANAGDDVQAHHKSHGGFPRADEGADDDTDDVEAHHKSHGGFPRADEGRDDDDGDDVEAHVKASNKT
jgi:hypothetical protein